MTRSLWTSEPEVVPSGWEFGVPGRHGTLRAYYGVGQSIVMLPADLMAAAVVATASLEPHSASRLRIALVSLLTFPVIASLILLCAYALLRDLTGSEHAAFCGAVVLQLGTTLLAYTQNNQENSLLLLLDLVAFWQGLRWLRSRSLRNIIAAYAALGFSMLVRLTGALDLLALTLLLFTVLRTRLGARCWRPTFELLGIGFLVVLPFVIVDRAYHWWRFGSLWSTYIHEFGAYYRGVHPEVPPSFPFSTPFFEGFIGPWLSPRRSVFVTDPLILLTAALAASRWRHWGDELRAMVIFLGLLLVAYVAFYATYYDWPGAHAWGDRFTTVPAQLLAMLAVPMLLAIWADARTLTRRAATLVIGSSGVVQVASVWFWFVLEEVQALNGVGSGWIVWQRAVNIVAWASGRFEAWGLAYPGFTRRAITPNFLPFLAEAHLPPKVAFFAQGGWAVSCVTLLAAVAYVALRSARLAAGGSSGMLRLDPSRHLSAPGGAGAYPP